MTGFSGSLQKAFKTLEDAEAYMKEHQVTEYTKISDEEHVEGAGWKGITLVPCGNGSQSDARSPFSLCFFLFSKIHSKVIVEWLHISTTRNIANLLWLPQCKKFTKLTWNKAMAGMVKTWLVPISVLPEIALDFPYLAPFCPALYVIRI